MLVPQLVVVSDSSSSASSESRASGRRKSLQKASKTIMAPPIEDANARKEFVERLSSDPAVAILRPFEEYFCKAPATNRVEELFGAVGKAGPKFYFNSINLHTWLCVTSILGFTAQIVPRDLAALASGTTAVPELVAPEIWVFGAFAVANFAQLLLAPTTFLNYVLINCVQDFVKTETTTTMPNPAQREENVSIQ